MRCWACMCGGADADNQAVKDKMEWAQQQRDAGKPTIPSTIRVRARLMHAGLILSFIHDFHAALHGTTSSLSWATHRPCWAVKTMARLGTSWDSCNEAHAAWCTAADTACWGDPGRAGHQCVLEVWAAGTRRVVWHARGPSRRRAGCLAASKRPPHPGVLPVLLCNLGHPGSAGPGTLLLAGSLTGLRSPTSFACMHAWMLHYQSVIAEIRRTFPSKGSQSAGHVCRGALPHSDGGVR